MDFWRFDGNHEYFWQENLKNIGGIHEKRQNEMETFRANDCARGPPIRSGLHYALRAPLPSAFGPRVQPVARKVPISFFTEFQEETALFFS